MRKVWEGGASWTEISLETRLDGDGDGGVKSDRDKKKKRRETMQMRRERAGEKVENDGGGREMGQTDLEPISRPKRNAPATPYRHKKRRRGGGG